MDIFGAQRRPGLTFGPAWNNEVLARLEAKQALAEVVLSHRGKKTEVWPQQDGTLRCICGNTWRPTAIDPLNKRCPVIVGFEQNCRDAGCTGAEIQAVWEGFRWAK